MITAGLIALLVVLAAEVVPPMLEFVSDTDAFRQYIRSRGARGVLRYVLMVVTQVLTGVVPAGPFQVAAGSAFGILPGTVICDLAMGLGSSIAFFLSKRFGMDYISMFVKKEKLASLHFLTTSPKKARLSFLVFLIPGMPKDLLTYILGMTDMKYRTFLGIALVGRFPTIFLTVISGDALAKRQGTLFIVMTAISAIAYIVGFLYYGRKFVEKKKEEK